MKDKDWSIRAEGEECVHITIDESINLSGDTEQELVILSETRTPIMKLKLNSHDIFLCCHTEKPMFAQIGHSVKYVSGSGYDFYKDVIEHKN